MNDKPVETENNNVSAENPALREYELAVKTQMHFNEIPMKFRSIGLAVVIAVYSYAITRKDIGVSLGSSLSPAQWIAIAGVAIAERLKISGILTTDRRHFAAIKPQHCKGFTLLP